MKKIRFLTFVTAAMLSALSFSLLQAAEVSLEKINLLSSITSDKYPDANAVVIKDNRQVKFEEDGTYVDRTSRLVKILTEQGKRSNAEAGFDYTLQYDTLKIVSAQVIKPDGSVIEVTDDMIDDVTHPALAAMNIYDAKVRVLKITFKGLEVGDAVEYEVIDSCYQAPMDNEYDTIELFQGFNPIVSQNLTINAPVSKPLHHLFKDGQVQFSENKQDGRIIYNWSSENIPRIISEPSMPSLHSFAPRLVASTVEKWETISHWWHDMAGQYRDSDDELRQTVADLTAGLESRDAKIKAIYHFVAQKIRYMGLGTGKKAGFEPKPASETLATRYGVCRDVAVLMASMLSEANIESEVVLTRAGELIDTEIPTLSFNHAIVAIKNQDGGYTFSDPTVENSPDLLLSAEGDANMLVCTAKGRDIDVSPHSPAKDNMGMFDATSRVDETGKLISDVTLTTKGIYDYAFRQFVKRFPPQQLAVIWQRIVTGLHPQAVLTGIDNSDPENLYDPFKLHFSYEVADYAIEAGPYLLVKSPVSTNNFELMLQSFLRGTGLSEREYPYDLGITLGSLQRETLELPTGYKIKSMPETVELGSDGLNYEMKYTGNTPSENDPQLEVNYEKEFMIDKKTLSVEEYARLKEILKTSSRSGRGEIILEKED